MGSENNGSTYVTFIQVVSGFPVMFRFWLPLIRTWIVVGKDSLNRLREQAEQNPQKPDAHIALAVHLLSKPTLSTAYPEEAVQELRTALRLLPNDNNVGKNKAQKNAMVHKFLGDALILLGYRAEAREHWKRTITLDPAKPPYGFSGSAQEMLNKYQGE